MARERGRITGETLAKRFEQQDRLQKKRLQAADERLTKHLEALETRATTTAQRSALKKGQERITKQYAGLVKRVDKLRNDIVTRPFDKDDDRDRALTQLAQWTLDAQAFRKKAGDKVKGLAEAPTFREPVTIDPWGLGNKVELIADAETYIAIQRARAAGWSDGQIVELLRKHGKVK